LAHARVTVGRYEIIDELGRGGMAVVYSARQTDLDRLVALKELPAFHATDPAFAERFLRESRIAGSLSHQNIVTVHEYFVHDGTPYIAMEFVERGSLRPYIGKLTLAKTGGVLEGLLAALAHAEQRRIVHRDLKPENLMISGEGTVKIADFGIAKALGQVSTGRFLTATGTAIGTPTYMSPEQAMGKEVGHATDLYAAGVIAYEMLVGRAPFASNDTPMAILFQHVNDPPPAARTIVPDIDPRIEHWLDWMLKKDPSERPRSAEIAWEAFEEVLLGVVGPRWRREARLLDAGSGAATAPLTPAPFHEEAEEPDDPFATYLPLGAAKPVEPAREAVASVEPSPAPKPPDPPVASAPSGYLTVPPASAAAAPSAEAVAAVEPPPTPAPPGPPAATAHSDYLTVPPTSAAAVPSAEAVAAVEPPPTPAPPEPLAVSAPSGGLPVPPAPPPEIAEPAPAPTPKDFETYLPASAPDQTPPPAASPEPVPEPKAEPAVAAAAIGAGFDPVGAPTIQPAWQQRDAAPPEPPAPAIPEPSPREDAEQPSAAPVGPAAPRRRAVSPKLVIGAIAVVVGAIGAGLALSGGGKDKTASSSVPTAPAGDGTTPAKTTASALPPAAVEAGDRMTLAFVVGRVWVGDPTVGRVTELDGATLAPTGKVNVPATPYGVAESGDRLIVGYKGGVVAYAKKGLVPVEATAGPAGATALVADTADPVVVITPTKICAAARAKLPKACTPLGFKPGSISIAPPAQTGAPFTAYVVDPTGGSLRAIAVGGSAPTPDPARDLPLAGANGPTAVWRTRATDTAPARTTCIFAVAGAVIHRLCDGGSGLVDDGKGYPLTSAPAALWVEMGASDSAAHLYAAFPDTGTVAIYDAADPSIKPQVIDGLGKPVAIGGSSNGVAAAPLVFVADAAGRRVIGIDDRDPTKRVSASLDTAPAKPVALTRVVGSETSGSVAFTLRLSGRFDPGALIVRSRAISGGSASFDIWQPGITAPADQATKGGARLRAAVGTGGAYLAIRITASAGAFTAIRIAPNAARDTVVVTLTKKPAPTVPTPPTGGGTGTPSGGGSGSGTPSGGGSGGVPPSGGGGSG
jgi:serine/threonine protein kinase